MDPQCSFQIGDIFEMPDYGDYDWHMGGYVSLKRIEWYLGFLKYNEFEDDSLFFVTVHYLTNSSWMQGGVFKYDEFHTLLLYLKLDPPDFICVSNSEYII